MRASVWKSCQRTFERTTIFHICVRTFTHFCRNLRALANYEIENDFCKILLNDSVTRSSVFPCFGISLYTTVIIINVILFLATIRAVKNTVDQHKSKSVKKAVSTSIAVSGLFILSLTPSFLNNLIKITCSFTDRNLDDWYAIPDLIEQWVYPLSTIGNPFLYTFINRSYRIYMMQKFSGINRISIKSVKSATSIVAAAV